MELDTLLEKLQTETGRQRSLQRTIEEANGYLANLNGDLYATIGRIQLLEELVEEEQGLLPPPPEEPEAPTTKAPEA